MDREQEAGVESRVSSGRDRLGREKSERLRGENVCRIRENTQRVRGVRGEEKSFWGVSDEKGLGEGLGTFSPLLLFHPHPPTSCVLLPLPPEPLAYSPGSGGGNRVRTGYHGNNSSGHGCVGEGWD